MKLERKSFNTTALKIEERKADEIPTITGHAAVFNTVAGESGWYKEMIAPNAFSNSIKTDDIRALWNHDTNHVMGRNRNKTLELWEDDIGLAVSITPPDTIIMRSFVENIKRGDVSQMSFGFEVRRSEWVESDSEANEYDEDLRIIHEVKLWEVSPVTFPFYEDTDVATNTHREWRSAMRTDDRRYKNIILRKKLEMKKHRRYFYE